MWSEKSKHKHFSNQILLKRISNCYLILFFKEFQNKIIRKKLWETKYSYWKNSWTLLVFIIWNRKASDTSWKLATQFVLLTWIAINHCQVLINFYNQNMAESSTSSGFIGMSGRRGQYWCVPECGSGRYDKFGNKTHISFHPEIRSHKSTKSWVKAINMYRRRVGGRHAWPI